MKTFTSQGGCINGDILRWRWLWPKLAADFGIKAAPYPGRPTPLEAQLADAGPTWARIAAKHGLAEADLGKLASAWHTDMDLGRELEVVTCIVEGCSNKDVAKQFAISEETVKRHLSNIFDKTGVSTRLELALFAIAHKLVVLD